MGAIGFTAPPSTREQRARKRAKEATARMKERYGVCFPGGHILNPGNSIWHEGVQYCATCVGSGSVEVVSRRWVYFIGDGAGHVKIGFTTNVGARLVELQTGNAFPLRVLATFQGSCEIEHALHARFAEHRVRNEWFRLVPEIVDFIESIPNPKPRKMKAQRAKREPKPKPIPEYVRIQQELARKQRAEEVA